MATWQPPIPAGALYSKPARELGPALALLAYCYDLVQTDGWFDIVLKEAAGDIGEPYPNVKRWWGMIQKGRFFAEAIDRGRHGWRVRFKDIWVDWRILKARAEREKQIPDEAPKVIPEETPAPVQVQMKDKSSTNKGSEMILEKPAYKEDIHDQESKDLGGAKRAPPSGKHQQLMAAYAEALGYKLTSGPQEAAAAKKILAAGFTPEQAIEVYQILKADQFYQGRHLSLQTVYKQMGAILSAPKVSTNGTHQNGRSKLPDLTVRRTRERLDID